MCVLACLLEEKYEPEGNDHHIFVPREQLVIARSFVEIFFNFFNTTGNDCLAVPCATTELHLPLCSRLCNTYTSKTYKRSQWRSWVALTAMTQVISARTKSLSSAHDQGDFCHERFLLQILTQTPTSVPGGRGCFRLTSLWLLEVRSAQAKLINPTLD